MRQFQALRKAGKTAESDKVAADWQKARPTETAFDMYFGDEALARKDPAEAERHYRAAADKDGGQVLALNNLAYVLALQGKPGAVEAAEKALKGAPNQVALLDTLAFALESANQLPRALEVQTRVVKLAPDLPQFRLQLARLKLKSGDKAAARDELKQLAKLGERFPRQNEVAELLKSAGG